MLLTCCLLFSIIFLYCPCCISQTDQRQSLLHGNKQSSAYDILEASNTNNISYIIYGTAWKGENTSKHVYDAIYNGFRFIDTACQPAHYNERGVGDGLKLAMKNNILNLNRKDIFIQTKFTPVDSHDLDKPLPYDIDAALEDQVRQSVETSLRNLQLSYIDSLILHTPYDNVDDTMRVWRVMESFIDNGIVKYGIGISNCYDYDEFVYIHTNARIKPWTVQNALSMEYSNFHYDIRQFCFTNSITYQSFWTLTDNADAIASDEMHHLATSILNLPSPQILMFVFLMSLENGYITPLSGTTSIRHMKDDIDLMERIHSGETIIKTDEELQYIAKLIGMPDFDGDDKIISGDDDEEFHNDTDDEEEEYNGDDDTASDDEYDYVHENGDDDEVSYDEDGGAKQDETISYFEQQGKTEEEL